MRQHRIGHRCAYLLLVFCMSACSFMPDVPSSNAPALSDADWPLLLPAEQLTALTGSQAGPPEDLSEETSALAARAAALRERAAAMTSPVLTAAERQRLAEAAGAR